ncbi:MAG: glycosyltransferase family 2 protein, partial [Candidatus Micrarchaeota archaeon]
IEKVITDIQKATLGQAEIVVVDGSKDRTPVIAKKLGARVIRQEPKGYGVAVKAALLAATKPIIVTVDCDGTYPASQIPELVSLVREGYDIVSGSRLRGGVKNMTLLNAFGNRMFALIGSLLYGIWITDVTTGMRAYKREVIQNINWTENTGLSAELILRPALKGYRIREVPIHYEPRLGDTKLNPFTGGARIFKSIIKCRFM